MKKIKFSSVVKQTKKYLLDLLSLAKSLFLKAVDFAKHNKKKVILFSIAFVSFALVLTLLLVMWYGSVSPALNSKRYRRVTVSATMKIEEFQNNLYGEHSADTEQESTEDQEEDELEPYSVVQYKKGDKYYDIVDGEKVLSDDEKPIFNFSGLDKIEKSDLEKKDGVYKIKFGHEQAFFDVIGTENYHKYDSIDASFWFKWGKVQKIVLNFIYENKYIVEQTYLFS